MNNGSTVVLEQNNPNPFKPGTSIRYTLPSKNMISLQVYNLHGQEIATLIDDYQDAGSYSVPFNAEGLPPGKYIYILRAGERYYTNVMTLE